MGWSVNAKSITIPEGAVKKITAGGRTIWQKTVAPSYQYIDPIDPVAFPNYTGLKIVTLDGTESDWRTTSGGVYTSSFASIIKNQDRESIVGFCADYTFLPNVMSVGSATAGTFIFNGTTTTPVNGNLSFKGENTTSADGWREYLAEHPLTILISTNDPDSSVWKPAKDQNGVTGYWNGADNFVAVHGGIPYYGENLLTEEIIQNFYSAWINTSYEWRSAGDSASVKIPVETGKYYRMAWDFTQETGTAFRYGFCDVSAVPPANLSEPRARTSPADNPSVDVLASNSGLVIQASRVTTADPQSIRFRQLTVREMVGYTPPVLMMGNPNPEPDPEEEDDA